MQSSESLGALFAALSAAQAEMRVALKDRSGQVGQQKTKYADLASVWEACRESLTKHKLCVVQFASADGNKVSVTTTLGHASGEWVSESLPVVARDASPQAVGSAITYARRYGLSSMVGVVPDDDDDGAAAQPREGHRATHHSPTRPEPTPRTDRIVMPEVVARIVELGTALGIDRAALEDRAAKKYGRRLGDLSPEQGVEIQSALSAKLAEKHPPTAQPPEPKPVRVAATVEDVKAALAPPAAKPLPAPPARTVAERVAAFAAMLVAQGLADPNELEQTLDEEFGGAWGPLEGWDDETYPQVRERCKSFEAGARSARAAGAARANGVPA